MNKEDLIVTKKDSEIIITFNGTKLIRPIQGFKQLSEDDIKQWFINEFNKKGED